MSENKIESRIAEILPRDLLIDLLDAATARARQANELIRNNTDLTGRRASWLEGHARFPLMEKGFQDTCELYGGIRLAGDLIAGTNLRCYQPFMRFGGSEPGVLLGLASMSEPEKLPAKNRSRLAGVTLNYHLTPRLDLEANGGTAKSGDIFVLFLFARDPSQGGHLQEVAIGIIDAEYKSFLAYEAVETFMEVYAPPSTEREQAPESRPLVTLKKMPKAFRAAERPASDKIADDPAE